MRQYTNLYPSKRSGLHTGDTMLFSGNGPISTGIKFGTLSKWTHVGMVIEGDVILLWESTTLKTQQDIDTGIIRSGVQICNLGRRVEEYDGEVAVRHLIDPLTPEEVIILHETRQDCIGRPYEENILELIKSAYDGPGGHNVEDLSSLFCSELLAMYYKQIHRLPMNVPSNEYTPKDFAGKDMDHMLGDIEYLKVVA